MNIKKYFSRGAQGKGYYIALVLCAIAIGTTGYLYARNVKKPADTGDVSPKPGTEDVAAIGTISGVETAPSGTTAPSSVPTQTEKRPMKTAAPVEGQTVAAYAMDFLDYNETTRDWRVHNGVDIAAEAGTDVCAAADGVVYTVYDDELMGTTVIVRHEDGYVTKYSSLDKDVAVNSGDSVTVGQTIGYVGDTALVETAVGTHVHFSVSKDGQAVDPGEFCAIGE